MPISEETFAVLRLDAEKEKKQHRYSFHGRSSEVKGYRCKRISAKSVASGDGKGSGSEFSQFFRTSFNSLSSFPAEDRDEKNRRNGVSNPSDNA